MKLELAKKDAELSELRTSYVLREGKVCFHFMCFAESCHAVATIL